MDQYTLAILSIQDGMAFWKCCYALNTEVMNSM
jgi:hypothetical protein